jgi:hypothetical protein
MGAISLIAELRLFVNWCILGIQGSHARPRRKTYGRGQAEGPSLAERTREAAARLPTLRKYPLDFSGSRSAADEIQPQYHGRGWISSNNAYLAAMRQYALCERRYDGAVPAIYTGTTSTTVPSSCHTAAANDIGALCRLKIKPLPLPRKIAAHSSRQHMWAEK